ncbi:hypothetical protein [Limnospira platensis]|nr:hypothetical protein [Arthrospira platensis]MDT9185884.1 hypothetical protein [Limnospira sp. PMC 289.06]MDT9298186.1 hypothetical protein [Arthrospira platensis PCC 7345]WAK73811.1 hypothetical protein AP9108_35535 [Arthrospira sp. PCC 9108]WAK73831.1 hypothetical protein AP9108_35610 [Arthrospira sp. PCC 9108]
MLLAVDFLVMSIAMGDEYIESRRSLLPLSTPLFFYGDDLSQGL